MPGFVKISNQIFSRGLAARDLMLYICLCGKANRLGCAIATYAALAATCNMDSKTVQAGVGELERRGLISRGRRCNARGYLANRYDVLGPRPGKTGWFAVECAVFDTQIRATDFLVYCYLRMQMSADRQEAFPSLSRIAVGTGLSRGRVAQAVAWLRRFTFVNRTKRRYKRTGAWRHNRYQPFKCNVPPHKKEVARTPKGPDHINQQYYDNTPRRKSQALFSKSAFFCWSRGSPQIPKQFRDVQTKITNKRKVNILYR